MYFFSCVSPFLSIKSRAGSGGGGEQGDPPKTMKPPKSNNNGSPPSLRGGAGMRCHPLCPPPRPQFIPPHSVSSVEGSLWPPCPGLGVPRGGLREEEEEEVLRGGDLGPEPRIQRTLLRAWLGSVGVGVGGVPRGGGGAAAALGVVVILILIILILIILVVLVPVLALLLAAGLGGVAAFL